MQIPFLVRGSIAAVLAILPVPAQSDTQELADASQRLRAALVKAAKMDALAFKSVESQDDAFRRRMPFGGAAEDVQITGACCSGMVHATIGYDDDQVLFGNGRMLARRSDGDWKLRRGCLADGQPLPFVPDPALLLQVLASLPEEALKVTHVEEGTIKDAKVVTYGFSLTGDRAQDLVLSGSLPRAAGGRMMIMIGGGGGLDAAKPEVTLDLAVSVEPESGQILRVHTKGYTKSELPGNVQVRFAGADGVEVGGEEEEEAAPPKKDGPPEYSKGLPKRHVDKNTSLTEFDLTLSKHGQAKLPELAEAQRKQLGLR